MSADLAAEYGFKFEKNNGVYRVYYDPLSTIRIEEGAQGISVNLKDAPLGLVLGIVRITATNIIYPAEIKERVNLTLYHVGIPELLTILADCTGYELEKTVSFILKKARRRKAFTLPGKTTCFPVNLTGVPSKI